MKISKNKGNKRIFLHPGQVISRIDGDRHFICAAMLAQLYGVTIENCFVINKCPESSFGYKRQDNDLHLFPRSDGKYKFRKKIVNKTYRNS